MKSILQQEYHTCKAEECCTFCKLYDGQLLMMKLRQRLSQARSVRLACCWCSISAVRSEWLFLVQARAQHRHLMTVQQAIQQQAIPVAHTDPASSDQQHAHNIKAMTHEHENNEKVIKETKKKIQVCAVAVSNYRDPISK